MEIGDRYGRWTVIEKLSGRPNLRVRCECGTEQSANSYNLKSGSSTQCRQCAFKNRKPRPAAADRDKAVLFLFKQYAYQDVKRAKRGIKFLLSLEEFANIISQDCELCGKPPSQVVTYTKVWPEPFKYTTVDRLDSNGHYESGNVRPLCWVCNKMKGTMSDEEFISHIKKILEKVI